MDEKVNELDVVEEMLVDKLAEDNSVDSVENNAESANEVVPEEVVSEGSDIRTDDSVDEEEEFFNSVGNTIEENMETGELPKIESRKLPFILTGAFLNDAIRILFGLILLVFSRMNFVQGAFEIILGITAAIICGIPLIFRALKDFKEKNYFNENILVFIAGSLCVLTGYSFDAVIALVIADIGFRLRDKTLEWYREEADKPLGENTSDNDKNLLDTIFHQIEGYFTPAVAFFSIIVALISLIFSGDSIISRFHAALAILAASAPLTLSVITALTYDIGKGSALKKGIRFTDVQSITSAAHLSSIIFNKTGTITTGSYTVGGIYPVRISAQQLIQLAAYAEIYSNHPLATAIKSYYGKELDPRRITQQREEKGSGSFVQLSSGEIIAVGNIELMEKLGVQGDMIPSDCVSVYVAFGKTFIGRIDFEDEVKAGIKDTVARIKKSGVANVAMITGDNTLSATRIARAVDINEVYADCTPRDKYERVKYISESEEKDDRMGFVVSAESDIKALEIADLKLVLGEKDINLPGTVFIPSADTTGIPAVIAEAKKIANMVFVNSIILLAAKGISILLALIGVVGISFVVALDIIATVFTAFFAMYKLSKR